MFYRTGKFALIALALLFSSCNGAAKTAPVYHCRTSTGYTFTTSSPGDIVSGAKCTR